MKLSGCDRRRARGGASAAAPRPRSACIAVEVDGRLVGEDELFVARARCAGPSRAPSGSGPSPASRPRRSRSGCFPSHFARYIAMSALRSSSSAVISSAERDADAGGDVDPGLAAGAELERLAPAPRAAVRRPARAPASSESPSEMTTNSSPPRRPSVSASRVTPSSRAATACSSWSPAPWPSVSLTSLKLSRSMKSAADRCCCAPRAGQHLLGAVEDQGPVGQPGERVVGGQEGELLLAAGELLVGAPALLPRSTRTSAPG